MKISNEFLIEQIRTVQRLVEADAIPDEISIIYGVIIGDRNIVCGHGDLEKTINLCFDILNGIFEHEPSSFMPAMLQFIEEFIMRHNSDKTEGDIS